jgi:hypothetical protein
MITAGVQSFSSPSVIPEKSKFGSERMTYRDEDELRTIVLSVSIAIGLSVFGVLLDGALWMT